jgi:large subunit ribosomal protein L25
MPDIVITADTGRPIGSRASGRLRAAGKIPAVIYGHGSEPLSVAVDGRALRSALSSDAGLNALLSLELSGGESHLAMAKDIQRHPVRGTVVHVDFLIVRRDEVIVADVPVILVGEAEQVHRGDGVVDQQLHALSVKAIPHLLPHSIEVDITKLGLGEAIRVGDITLPAGVETEVDPEAAVVVGHPPAGAAEGAEAGEAEAVVAGEETGEAGESADAGEAGAGSSGGDGAAN